MASQREGDAWFAGQTRRDPWSLGLKVISSWLDEKYLFSYLFCFLLAISDQLWRVGEKVMPGLQDKVGEILGLSVQT